MVYIHYENIHMLHNRRREANSTSYECTFILFHTEKQRILSLSLSLFLSLYFYIPFFPCFPVSVFSVTRSFVIREKHEISLSLSRYSLSFSICLSSLSHPPISFFLRPLSFLSVSSPSLIPS